MHDQLKKILNSLSLAQYFENFVENDLEDSELKELTAQDLKEIGITSLGHRKKILKAISEPVSQYSDFETKVIEQYPYVIAYPFKDMLDKQEPLGKINLLKDLFNNILKYYGLLCASEYFNSNIKDKTINKLFRDNLYSPSFGQWNGFIREILKALDAHKHQYVIPELKDSYQSIQTAKKSKKFDYRKEVNEDGQKKEIVVKETAINILINFRNRYLGHGQTPNDFKARELYEQFYPAMHYLLSQMEFVTNYPMIKFERGTAYSLMGCNINAADGNPSPQTEGQSLWIEDVKKLQFPLCPFFISPLQYMTKVDAQILIYEQFTGKRIVFFSPEREVEEAEGELLKKLSLVLYEKNREELCSSENLTTEGLLRGIKETTDESINSLLDEKKVLPGIYQSRTDAEIALRSFPGSHYGLFFIAAEAGSGKTNLLYEMTRQYRESGQTTLFMRAGRMKNSDLVSELKQRLNLSESFDFQQAHAFEFTQDSPLLILIDGGNENNRPEDFLESLTPFLNLFVCGSVKIILSWRVTLMSELPELSSDLDDYLYPANGDESSSSGLSPLQKNALKLKKMNRAEIEGAWKKYTDFRMKKMAPYKPKFTLADLEFKNRILVDTFSNPLNMRLFLEMNCGKKLSTETAANTDIWSDWFKSTEKTIAKSNSFLKELALECFKQRSASIEIDSLYNHPVLAQYIKDDAVDSPYRRLLKAGTLACFFRDNIPKLGFAVEAMFIYILAELLGKEPAYAGVESLIQLAGDQSLYGLDAVVEYILIEDVREGRIERVNSLIDNYPEQCHLSVRALCTVFETDGDESALRSFLEAPTENKLIALNAAIVYLKLNYRNDTLQKISEFVSKEDNFPECEAYATLLDTASDFLVKDKVSWDYANEQELNLLFKSLELRKTLNTEDSLACAYSYEKIANRKDYLKYAQLAYDIYSENLDFGHPKTTRILVGIFEKILSKDGMKCTQEKYTEIIARLEEKIDGYEFVKAEFHLILANYYSTEWDLDKAIGFQKQAMTFFENELGLNHPVLAKAYDTAGALMIKDGNASAALKYYDKALKIYDNTIGELHPDTMNFRKKKCSEYSFQSTTDSKLFQRALSLNEKNLRCAKKMYSQFHPDIISAYTALALLYKDNLDKCDEAFEKALSLYHSVLELQSKDPESTKKDKAQTYFHMAELCFSHEAHEESLSFYERSLILRNDSLGKNHHLTQAVVDCIINLHEEIGDFDKAESFSSEWL